MSDKYIFEGKITKVPDNDGGGCATIIIILAIIGWLFSNSVSEEDLGKTKYLSKAETAAEELVLNWQARNWEPRGFTNLRGDPGYKVKIATNKSGDIHERVENLGGGEYGVVVVTQTFLHSKKMDTTSVYEWFYVRVQTDPKDFGENWHITAGEIYDMRPSQAELDATIQSWAY